MLQSGQAHLAAIMSFIKRRISELSDDMFTVPGRHVGKSELRSGFYTPSPPPRISNSPTLFFGDIGSFSVSNFNGSDYVNYAYNNNNYGNRTRCLRYF